MHFFAIEQNLFITMYYYYYHSVNIFSAMKKANFDRKKKSPFRWLIWGFYCKFSNLLKIKCVFTFMALNVQVLVLSSQKF